MPHKQEICTTMYGLAPTTTRENRCIIDRVIKLKIFAIHWFSLKFLVFYNREKEPHSYCHKLWLAAFGRQNALQAKKRDIFPAGKVWFSPSAPPPIFPRSGNSLFGSQTTCASQIYSPLSATAKICSFGQARTLNTDRFQCSSIYLLKKWDSENF